ARNLGPARGWFGRPEQPQGDRDPRRRPAKYRREQRARCVSWSCLPYRRTTPSVIERNCHRDDVGNADVLLAHRAVTFCRATDHLSRPVPATGPSSNRRRTGSAKSVRADERGYPATRGLVWLQELWREHHGVKTVARPPERQSSLSRSVPSELPCRDAVLLDLEVQSLVVGSEESRRCALIPPRGMKG